MSDELPTRVFLKLSPENVITIGLLSAVAFLAFVLIKSSLSSMMGGAVDNTPQGGVNFVAADAAGH